MKSNEISQPAGLSKRQVHALPYILGSPSYEEAGRQAKVSSKQIHEWLKDPSFRQELERQRSNVFFDSLSSLKTQTQKAIQVLAALLEDQDPRIRLSAAERVLSNAFKGTELLELEARISALEGLAEKHRMKNGLSK